MINTSQQSVVTSNVKRLNLTPAEKKVYHTVKTLGSLRCDMVPSILKTGNCSQTAKKHIIPSLVSKGCLFYSKKKDYLLSLPMEKPQKNITYAFFILQKYLNLNQVDPFTIYKPILPATIGFATKNGQCIEVVYIPDKKTLKEYALAIEEQYQKTQIEKEKPFMRYIFVLKNREEIRTFPLENITYPFEFAIENFLAEDGISFNKYPTITYLKPKK